MLLWRIMGQFPSFSSGSFFNSCDSSSRGYGVFFWPSKTQDTGAHMRKILKTKSRGWRHGKVIPNTHTTAQNSVTPVLRDPMSLSDLHGLLCTHHTHPQKSKPNQNLELVLSHPECYNCCHTPRLLTLFSHPTAIDDQLVFNLSTKEADWIWVKRPTWST